MSETKHLWTKRQTITGVLLFVIFMVPLTGRSQQQAHPLSLQEAVDSALMNNHQIQQYQQQVKQKEYLVKAARGNHFLSLDATGGYTYLSKSPEINMSKVEKSVKENMNQYATTIAQSGLIPTQDLPLFSKVMQQISQLPLYNITVDQQQYPNLNVTAMQPLYTGGKIKASVNYAKADLGQSKQQLQQIQNQIIRETVKNYYAVVLLKEVVKTRENMLAGMQKHLRQAEKAFQVGLIPTQDVLRARVAVANAEQALDDDQNNLALAQLALNTTIGNTQENSFSLTDTLYYFPMPLHLGNLQRQASVQQPILKMIDQQQIMAKQKMVKDRSVFLPQIAAFGTYTAFQNNNPVTLPPFIVGVQAKINLFDGLKKVNEIRATRHLENQISAARNYAAGQISLWVNKSYLQALNNQTKYLKMQPTLQLSARNLHITEKRFQEGLSKSIDVIDAYLLYEKIETEQLEALYNYYLSLTDVYMATGHTEKVIDILQHSTAKTTN